MGRKKKIQNEPVMPLTITFMGDPNAGNDPEIADWHGLKFPINEPVTVEDAEWLALHGDKLRRHSHFKVEP